MERGHKKASQWSARDASRACATTCLRPNNQLEMFVCEGDSSPFLLDVTVILCFAPRRVPDGGAGASIGGPSEAQNQPTNQAIRRRRPCTIATPAYRRFMQAQLPPDGTRDSRTGKAEQPFRRLYSQRRGTDCAATDKPFGTDYLSIAVHPNADGKLAALLPAAKIKSPSFLG